MPSVLLVDDDRTMVGLLHSLLKLDGFDAIDGAGGVDFVGTARAVRPDAILMDVFLSGKDGLQLLRSLKADPDTAGIPVIMTSGMEMSEECRRLGADEFLLKPYSPDTLVEVLRRITNQTNENPTR
ncbi:MAG: response regulator [Anaerolineales bacterium]|nr:response regulator [Anaerolineales bacterium]